MLLKGSLDSLARRPKDTGGPAAVAHSASIVIFSLSLLLALVSPVFSNIAIVVLCSAVPGIVGGWILALIAARSLRQARRTALIELPFAAIAIVFLVAVAVARS